MRPDTVVVLPTYNEAENLPRLAPAVLAHDVDILVVDDGSPDGTGQIADKLTSDFSHVNVLHREEKAGLGKAYAAGFAQALSAGYAWMGSMDADFSHDPEELGLLLDARKDADLVLGSRYVPGGSIPNWSTRRKMLSKGGNLYARIMLGLKPRDVTGGFRLYSAQLLERLEPGTCRASGYGFQIEMIRRAQRLGAEIIEVPITFRDRSWGESKMSASIVLEAMGLVTAWGLRRLWSKLPWTDPEDRWS